MAYTVEFSDGSGTYVCQVQPKFDRSFDYVYNDDVNPPVLVEELETWTLKGVVYAGAEGDVTADFETLRGILSDRLVPLTAVLFKRDGAPVFQLTTATHQ